jgi:hypothetical protein
MKITVNMLTPFDQQNREITKRLCVQHARRVDWGKSARQLLSEEQHRLWDKLTRAAAVRCALADDNTWPELWEEYQITCAKAFYIASKC